MVISVNNNPVANAGIDTAICSGSTANLHAMGGTIYQWNTGSAQSKIQVSPLSTTTYFVTVSDANGCTAKGSVVVTVNPVPTSDFTIIPTPICVEQLTTITFKGNASAGATYKWNIDGDVSKTGAGPYQVSWTAVGNKVVTLTVIDKLCSSTETSNNIFVNALPMADFTATNTSGCQPLTVNFTDNSKLTNASSTYYWDFGDGENSTEQNPGHIYNSSGKFTVTLIVSNAAFGCDNKKIITDLVDVLPKPEASYYVQPGTTVSELNPTVYVFSNSKGKINKFKWKLSDADSVYTDSSFIHVFALPGIYDISLVVVNGTGCIDSTVGKITVKKDFTIYVPTAFIPGKCLNANNCDFRVQGTNISQFKINIYNRWGAVIYFSEDIEEGWDGRLKGSPADQGVYVYRIDYRDVNHKSHTLWGSVTLIR